MRSLIRLALALVGIVVVMNLLYTFRPSLIRAWEDPVVRFRVMLLSLPLTAFLVAHKALPRQAGMPKVSGAATISRGSLAISSVPTENSVEVPARELSANDAEVAAKPVRKYGSWKALTMSFLVGLPPAVIAARYAVTFFGRNEMDGLFDLLRPEGPHLFRGLASIAATTVAALLSHNFIIRIVGRRTRVEVAALAAILLNPIITFAISYQACWVWIRLYPAQ